MVALQALAKFSKLAFDSSNMTVSMAAAGSMYSYSIDASNSLVLQSQVVSITF